MSVKTIETMASWIQQNLSEDPSLIRMSSYVGYSPYYCSVKFREHMGVTYKQYLSKCRVTAAAEDLKHSIDSITAIAHRYGYCSSESLARAFQTAFCCSPSQYRMRYRYDT